MIGTPFFGGHVVRWTPYFRGTSLTLIINVFLSYSSILWVIWLLGRTVFDLRAMIVEGNVQSIKSYRVFMPIVSLSNMLLIALGTLINSPCMGV